MRGSSNNSLRPTSTLRLVLLGPPGAGKGTQSELLTARLGLPHISTGELLREAQHAGGRLGQIASTYLARGDLVPDQVITGVVEQRLRAAGADVGFILDGFPRTIAQADELNHILDSMGVPLDGVLYYDVPIEELIRRLAGRRVCDGCGRIYHFDSDQEADGEVCSVCKGHLYRREDDSPTAIRTRMKIYKEVTEPLVEYYRRRRVLYAIPALGSVEDIYLRSLRALGVTL